MYGGMQPGFWNDGAHGVITLAGDTQYVHVLTKPTSQDLVRLRDNGYKITAVSDLRTGKRMPGDAPTRPQHHHGLQQRRLRPDLGRLSLG
jgi:hypothetical protein